MNAERPSDVWSELLATEPVARESRAEEVLAAAVLRLAFEDFQKHRGDTDVRRRRAFREAVVWIRSNERQWPFSFLNVCDMLDLSPAALRAKLLTDS